MIITKDSHLDHGLTVGHLAWLLRELGEREGFAIVELDVPADLVTVSCDLVGPAMGNPAVEEREVHYRRRGDRPGETRMVAQFSRETRKLTAIIGPDEQGRTILYTAYRVSRSILHSKANQKARSVAFWKEHALADPLSVF